jgi:hypothetical protein
VSSFPIGTTSVYFSLLSITVNSEQNSGFFWAIRCGGGNFGIVTTLTFQAGANGKGIMSNNKAPKKTKRYCQHMCLELYFY